MKFLIIAFAATLGGFLMDSGVTNFSSQELARYEINASKSRFMVHANRTGPLWFKGHSHRIAARDFSGEASLTPNVLNPASLEMTVKSESLEETDPEFTQEQKNIINKELDDIVLESAKYPEISFKSTQVTGQLANPWTFEIRITGDLTLHGVTKQITIPASVTLSSDSFRAVGEFDIDRDDFGVKATSAFHGTIRVKNNIKFVFDIIANRI
jgi:polyisoprenoid-binding protein YceI